MAKAKGSAKTGGRVKGQPNKVTRELKDMILQALDKAGGVKYLQDRAGDSPAAFLSLVGKVLPMTIKADGAAGALVYVARVPAPEAEVGEWERKYSASQKPSLQ